MKEDILHFFEVHLEPLRNLEERLKDSLLAQIAQAGLQVDAVFSRLKTRESLKGKIHSPDRTYQSIDEVHDLLGLRVVTYFEDGVQEVADLIEKNYQIDFAHSLDKGLELNPTQFGYRSLHYICVVPQEFAIPTFPSLRFEIQVRSILQHAWAQMEHDLGYKSKESLPLAFRRRFSRLAGLLEIADEEFMALRRGLQSYSKAAEEGRSSLPIDSISLSSFVHSDLIAELDSRVAGWLQAKLEDETFYPEYLARMLDLVGLADLGQLRRLIQERQNDLEAGLGCYFQFSERVWGLSREEVTTVERGYCLLFLAHLHLLGQTRLEIERVEKLTAFYHALDYPTDPQLARKVALSFLEAFRDWT